ncbi:hypothetical protein D3C84_1284970 [compost metagenome]
MINLGDHLPCAVNFDQGQIVIVVGADRILLHIDTHYSCRRSDSQHVESGRDFGGIAVLLNEIK